MLKKAIVILAILVFSVLYYMGVMTGKETLPFSREFFAVESPPVTEPSFDIKGARPSKGNTAGQNSPTLTNKEIDQLYQMRMDRGLRNVPVLSFWLLREAGQARSQGDPDLAVRLASESVRFSPDLAPFYFELAKVQWRQNPFQISKALWTVVDGVTALTSYFSTALCFYYNVFYIFANAVLLTFMVFGIIVLVKYFPLFVYDIQRNLDHQISKVIKNSLRIFLFFIPFFLRVDILWAVLYWGVLLWGYVPKKERYFLLLFLICLVYLPYALRSASSFLDSPSAEILLDMNRTSYENWDEATEQRMHSWGAAHPEDPEALLAIGLLEKRQGRFDRAEKLYQTAIQKNPGFAEAYSNLGNVYLARKQTEQAVASFEKAAALDPRKAAYQFNLYRAYSQQTLLSNKSDSAFQRARQLDSKLVDTYLAMDSSKQTPNINRFSVDEGVSPARLWGRVRSYFMSQEGILYLLFRAWFEKVPSRVTFLLPVFFLAFLILMSRYSKARKFMTRCPMCGSPTYRFYLGASAQDFICFNCYRMFIQRENLHRKMVEKKSIQVGHFQQENSFIGRFISHFIVGFGYVWRGNYVRGILMTVLFFFFVLRFVYWNGVITLSWVRLPPTFWSYVIWGGLFVLLYAACLAAVYRLKPRFRERPQPAGGQRREQEPAREK